MNYSVILLIQCSCAGVILLTWATMKHSDRR